MDTSRDIAMPGSCRSDSLALAVLAVALLAAGFAAEGPPAPAVPPALPAPAVQPAPRAPAALAAPPPQAVVLRSHPTPRVPTGASDATGAPVTIACSNCHAMRPPNALKRQTSDLSLFHQGLQIRHGMNACLSCHHPGDYDSLHLADGRSVSFANSIDLCSQCHGTQRRDYDRGAHGGMSGFWDLARGGRVRNTCVNCHDAHVPRYQGALPMPPPRDRFLGEAEGEAHHG